MKNANWDRITELSRSELIAVLDDLGFNLDDNDNFDRDNSPAEGTKDYSDEMQWLREHLEQGISDLEVIRGGHPELVNVKDAVREHVGTDELAAYLKAPFGYFAGLYANGVFHVGQDVGNEIAQHERPVFISQCPGVGNLDSSEYTAGYAHVNEDGKYVRNKDGSMIGDGNLEALINDTCENGDCEDWVEELISDLVSE